MEGLGGEQDWGTCCEISKESIKNDVTKNQSIRQKPRNIHSILIHNILKQKPTNTSKRLIRQKFRNKAI